MYYLKDLDKLKRTLKSLESDPAEDNVKSDASADHSSLKDSSERNETSSDRSISRSSSIVETSEFTDRRPPPIYTRSNSITDTTDAGQTQAIIKPDHKPYFSNPNTTTHASAIENSRRIRRYSSADQNQITGGSGPFDFSLQLPSPAGNALASSSYSNFPPRPDVYRTQSCDEFSWLPGTN